MSPDRSKQELLWTNPFSTHRVRPGTFSYRFSERPMLGQLMDRLRRNHWCGQIIGPHGTGKTTLLRTLDGHWFRYAREPVQVVLRDGQRWLPPLPWKTFDVQTQLIVDGYEQLGWLARCRLRWHRRRRRCGLLVTSHRKCDNLSVLYRTHASPELTRDLTRQLLSDSHAGDFEKSLARFLGCTTGVGAESSPFDREPTLLETRFAQAGGNVRETLMLLYDDAETYYQSLIH